MDRDDSETEEEVEEKKRPGSESTRKTKHTLPTTKRKSSTAAKRSDHKKQRCQVPGCKFDGYNLKRHMQIHVKIW